MITRVVAALATTITSVVLLVPAPPAYACSCVGATTAGYAQWADAVFTGTITSARDRNRAVVFEVAVDRAWKGKVADVVEVATADQGPACGLPDLPEGEPILWFASGKPGHLSTSSCSGTGEVSAKEVRAVTNALGQPREPSAAIEDVLKPPEESRYQDLFVALGIAGGVLAAAGIAYVVVRRRRTSAG